MVEDELKAFWVPQNHMSRGTISDIARFREAVGGDRGSILQDPRGTFVLDTGPLRESTWRGTSVNEDNCCSLITLTIERCTHTQENFEYLLWNRLPLFSTFSFCVTVEKGFCNCTVSRVELSGFDTKGKGTTRLTGLRLRL